MTQAGTASWDGAGVTRTDVILTADPTRVLARLFVPGHELLTRRPVPGVWGPGDGSSRCPRTRSA